MTEIEELIEEIMETYNEGHMSEDRLYSFLQQLKAKEKEQREELIKEVAIESYNGAIKNEVSGDAFFIMNAEQYYNEVIKNKLC